MNKDGKIFALHYYFTSNPTQRESRQKMIEIWQECTRFKTNQRIADQTRMTIKKYRFSKVDILKIQQQMNKESSQ